MNSLLGTLGLSLAWYSFFLRFPLRSFAASKVRKRIQVGSISACLRKVDLEGLVAILTALTLTILGE